MALLNVLLDASGNILGTMAVVAASGSNPPASAQLVAGPGQRLTRHPRRQNGRLPSTRWHFTRRSKPSIK